MAAAFCRCTYLNSGARNRPELPPLYYELSDAFEEKLLSICADVPGYEEGTFYNIQGGQGFVKCDACRTFMRDRMTNQVRAMLSAAEGSHRCLS